MASISQAMEPPRSFAAMPSAAEAAEPTARTGPDHALLAAARRGDRGAFERIIHAHQGFVYGYLRARLTQASDAEDLCQEVFLRCYAGRDRFDRAAALRPWLVGIARNLLREHVRRLRRRREVAWTEMCLELDELVEDGDAFHDEALAWLGDCLDSLGESAREALDLRYHARLPLAEIAPRLRRSEGAVKLLMFRAREALKNCIDRRLRGLHRRYR